VTSQDEGSTPAKAEYEVETGDETQVDLILPIGRFGTLSRADLCTRLERIEFIRAELRRRKVTLNPCHYGAPDLLFPQGYAPGVLDSGTLLLVREPLPEQETLEQYHERQNSAVLAFVTTHLKLIKDDRLIPIVMIPQAAKILSDLFYGRVKRLILWANRGGSKSLSASIFMWLSAVYRKQSCLNMGGAGEQARRIYDYTKQFWDSFPGMGVGMLAREPLLELTQLKNGTQIICATTKTRAIGEHAPIFVCDEVMSDRPGSDEDIMRAMQGPLSEPDSVIFLLSTFHKPIGLFANIWDTADEMGFTRASWDTFHCMEKCEVGLERATPEDPLAVEAFCKKECPLSWERDTTNAAGVVTGKEWVGCLGRARSSAGWEPRERVLEKKQINKGTQVFEVEHANLRPKISARVFSEAALEACVVPGFDLVADKRKVIGIDWGMTECAMALLGEWSEETKEDLVEGLGVVDAVFMAGKTVKPVIRQIQKWQETYGDDIFIRADGSHPYNNKELGEEGYKVRPVHGDKTFLGEDNLGRWMASGQFRILQHLNYLLEQFKNLKRSTASGKQVKQNKPGVEGDHGPDAVKFAALEWNYVKWFKKRQKEEASAAIADTATEMARQRRAKRLPMRGDFHGRMGFI
jgi:hypothetical protein